MGEEDKTLASGPHTAPTVRDEATVAVPPHEFLTGTRYELGERLGEGRMGEIVSCKDAELGREVAAKKLRALEQRGPRLTDHTHHAGRTEAEVMARFLRETRVQAQLEHPGIVPVYDMLEDEDGRPFFTMQKSRA
jgi:eukaryotic-like serine/threonine-protein kinase